MVTYVAIIEDAGPDKAVGVWFPDLPGCFSAGDTMDEALVNAPQAVELYAETFERTGRHLPQARTLAELRTDPSFADDVRGHLVAVVQLPQPAASAAKL
jgi:predicted RNase H-like HicB family nuclease